MPSYQMCIDGTSGMNEGNEWIVTFSFFLEPLLVCSKVLTWNVCFKICGIWPIVPHMFVARGPRGGSPLTCPRQQHSPKMITGQHPRQRASPSVAEKVSIWSFVLVVRVKGREMRVDRSCHGRGAEPENICLDASNSRWFDSDLWPERYLAVFCCCRLAFNKSWISFT